MENVSSLTVVLIIVGLIALPFLLRLLYGWLYKINDILEQLSAVNHNLVAIHKQLKKLNGEQVEESE